MPRFNVMLTVSAVVDADDEVAALTDAKTRPLADMETTNVTVSRVGTAGQPLSYSVPPLIADGGEPEDVSTRQ